ncbi:MAG: GAF domain-containing protein, partial [Anaerolineae bacterium]
TWIHAELDAVMQPIKTGARLSPQQMPVVNYVAPGRPMIVNNVSADEVTQPIRLLMHRFGIEAMIALPMVAGRDLLGILFIGYRHPHVFQPDEIQTLLTLSGQAGTVLQTQRSLTETQAAVQQLNLLNRRLTGEAWLGYAQPLGGQLTVQDTAPSVSDDALAAELKTPLIVRGETIGSLGLQDTQPDRMWSDSDRELLAAVANEVAAAIDNARLLEQTERRVQRERLLAEISRKMLAARDLTHIARVAGEELGRALHVAHLGVVIGADSPAPEPGENGLRDKEGTL